MKQLQISLTFQDSVTGWINCEKTSRDEQFITIVIKNTYMIYHAVSEVIAFETRIIETEAINNAN